MVNITTVPKAYKDAVQEEFKGTLADVSYRVSNYINQSRQLVTNQDITSNEAGRETVKGEELIKKCCIYLPAGYDENDKNTKYDVLYLLHGVCGNRFEWLSGNRENDGNNVLCNIFDNLIANGDIEPLIIVFPEGRSAYDWTNQSFEAKGTHMLGFYHFDYELRYDLIPFIESEYNTYAEIQDNSAIGMKHSRLHRAIAGLSMGGMQSLNLVLGGYRCDSIEYTEGADAWGNGLSSTVITPGMSDLFAHVGAFSNAPTSSDGEILGRGISSSDYSLPLLYMTCGDADEIAYQSGFKKAINGLKEASGDNLGEFYKVIVKEGLHNHDVWHNGAYNYIRLCFQNTQENSRMYEITI